MELENDKAIYVTKSSLPPFEEYVEMLRPLWESHWLTNMGTYHQELERRLAEHLKVPEISLMVNGHMALEMTLQAFDFPRGSEIITTPFTFISTTHAIVRNGLQPVFCDVKETDGTIDESKIEALITPNTVAILPVHVYGNACNVLAIQEIASRHGLKVIYDAAHAFGVEYAGQGIGNYGDASIFSFHATKVFHTIEGGAVVCKEHELYEKLYNLKNFGIRGEELVTAVGANAKMNEFCAAMGLCNLKYIDGVQTQRKLRYEQYVDGISKIEGLRLLSGEGDGTKNYSYLTILVDDKYPICRDELYDVLLSEGIHPRKYFYPLTKEQVCYKKLFGNATTPVAEKLSRQVLVLPLYEDLDEKVIGKVLSLLKELV